MKRVVIVGAGFGGLALAKGLKNSNVEVLLLDKHNYHSFQPLLYQVATGGLEPDSIAYPVRRIFRESLNLKFRLAEVTGLQKEKQLLQTNIGDISYDYLVVASGSANNFFNFEPIKEQFFSLKSVPEALDIRSYLMQKLEAVIASDQGRNHDLVHIVIIGGGPAGIELAGAISEMKRYVVSKDFPEIDIDKIHIHLFEAAPKLLAAMSEASSAASKDYLAEMGVDVKLDAKVVAYENEQVILASGESFPSDLVIWTAGVKGNPINGLEDCILAGNRLAVNEFNQLRGEENIFAIGDVASCVNDMNPRGLPMLAQVAMQQGAKLAKNIIRLDAGKEMEVFTYYNKGTMATIGRNRAVVDLPQWKFQGRFAWFVWMFIHLISLVGFRNKIVVFVDWVQNYFNYDRPLGLIIRKFNKRNK